MVFWGLSNGWLANRVVEWQWPPACRAGGSYKSSRRFVCAGEISSPPRSLLIAFGVSAKLVSDPAGFSLLCLAVAPPHSQLGLLGLNPILCDCRSSRSSPFSCPTPPLGIPCGCKLGNRSQLHHNHSFFKAITDFLAQISIDFYWTSLPFQSHIKK